ncbi:uncharacterized protein LOC135206991 [Macrobrachium nipponense]|uniref:uncharacterized protein LOC135206991 n=1 Tax=Macrobrachium nipponense TaxID=159736 RepID=UPI0030C839C3
MACIYRFLHITEEEKQTFRTTGRIGPHLLEQAMCKALLQDVTLDGVTPTCKEYLQGCCEWMSCPLLHVSRQEFSEAIIDIMMEKFEAVLGSPERYHGRHKSAYDTSARHREPVGYVSSSFRDTHRQDRYAQDTDEAYGIDYSKRPNWYNEQAGGTLEYDQQGYISTETNRIIKGIYNLMKADAGLLRNTDKYEVTDLRLKLNSLAEENARCHYQYSRMQEVDGYKPLIPSPSGTDNLNYQDIVRRLERENLEMRRELAMLQGREENNAHGGRYGLHQGNFNAGSSTGQSHSSYDRRMYVLPKPASNPASNYNPVKQKINNQLKQNMLKQYKSPLQMKQGASYYGKAGYQKHPQFNKKNQQKKTVGNKINQTQKKQSPNSNQAKPNSAKNVTQSKDNQDNKEANNKKENSSVDTEEKPIVDAHSRDEDTSSGNDTTSSGNDATSSGNHATSSENHATSSGNDAECDGDVAGNHTNNESEGDSDEEPKEKQELTESETTSENAGSGEEPEPDLQELENWEKEKKILDSDASDKVEN